MHNSYHMHCHAEIMFEIQVLTGTSLACSRVNVQLCMYLPFALSQRRNLVLQELGSPDLTSHLHELVEHVVLAIC